MPKKKASQNTIAVVTVQELEGIRRVGQTAIKRLDLDPEQLAININLFLEQMGEVVAKTPPAVGKFQLSEIELSAEITGKGQVVLWGIGGELGAGGGIKFVFKKQPATNAGTASE